MNKIYYDWEMFDEDIIKIANNVKNNYLEITSIYGIPRGGLPMAVSLSHILQLPLKLSFDEIDKNTLIVDDISDSGETLIKLKNEYIKLRRNKKITSSNNKCKSFDNIIIITLFFKLNTKFIPTFYCRQSSKDDWIVFPWEFDNKCVRDGTDIK